MRRAKNEKIGILRHDTVRKFVTVEKGELGIGFIRRHNHLKSQLTALLANGFVYFGRDSNCLTTAGIEIGIEVVCHQIFTTYVIDHVS